MLAYVFWHWKRPPIGEPDYEERQRSFHAALRASPPDGFIRSSSAALAGASWACDGGPSYEDWYFVQDYAALGHLNEAAISGSRAAPHQGAASAAAGGTAGIYRLWLGDALRRPRLACWFSRPEGVSYFELKERLAPVIGRASGALWMRQMTLGPAREFCLHAETAVELPPPFAPLTLDLRPVWPDP